MFATLSSPFAKASACSSCYQEVGDEVSKEVGDEVSKTMEMYTRNKSGWHCCVGVIPVTESDVI